MFFHKVLQIVLYRLELAIQIMLLLMKLLLKNRELHAQLLLELFVDGLLY